MGTLQYINLFYYTFSTGQIYHTWIVHEYKCLSSFLFFRFSSNCERERGYIKLGIRRNGLKVYLSFFSTGFLWYMFLLLRANRLYAIFNTGLKKWFFRVRDILFVFFYPEYLAFGFVRHEPCPTTNFFFSISADRRECSRRVPRGLFWTSVRSVALEKEQWQTWGL